MAVEPAGLNMALGQMYPDVPGMLEGLDREVGVLVNLKVMADGQRSPGFDAVI